MVLQVARRGSTVLQAVPGAVELFIFLEDSGKRSVAANSRAITVRGRRGSGSVELAVSDDGLGYSREDAGMLFEKFQRLGDELRRATPGTGLGLYIVRRLVELSGGRVHAHSDGLRKGATVTLRWAAPDTSR